MYQVFAIPAFSDNYIWCIQDAEDNVIIVDPGCANTVEAFLVHRNLTLSTILVTHHHQDHIGGVRQLKERFAAEIIGFKGAQFDFLDTRLAENEQVTRSGITFKVIEVPGHTLDHIAFFADIPIVNNNMPHEQTSSSPCLFCGDTLFSAGCGRLFEGTPQQMLNSLQKLTSLPPDTFIFCAHEYTLSNIRFAKALMPENKSLIEYEKSCQTKRSDNLPTLPSTLATELEINPFLRWDDKNLISHLQQQELLPPSCTAKDVFAATRKMKDHF